jgi:hypothetical protein
MTERAAPRGARYARDLVVFGNKKPVKEVKEPSPSLSSSFFGGVAFSDFSVAYRIRTA